MFAGVSGDFLCLGRFRLTFGVGYLMFPAVVCVCVYACVCVEGVLGRVVFHGLQSRNQILTKYRLWIDLQCGLPGISVRPETILVKFLQ